MSEKPYHRIKKEEKQLILRDYLAIDRTLLANESSLLAYIRTSLTMLVAGVTLPHVFPSSSMTALGWSLVLSAGALILIGIHRYNANAKVLTDIVSRGQNRTIEGRRYQLVHKLYNFGHGIFKKI
jgi:putative membrane protein